MITFNILFLQTLDMKIDETYAKEGDKLAQLNEHHKKNIVHRSPEPLVLDPNVELKFVVAFGHKVAIGTLELARLSGQS